MSKTSGGGQGKNTDDYAECVTTSVEAWIAFRLWFCFWLFCFLFYFDVALRCVSCHAPLPLKSPASVIDCPVLMCCTCILLSPLFGLHHSDTSACLTNNLHPLTLHWLKWLSPVNKHCGFIPNLILTVIMWFIWLVIFFYDSKWTKTRMHFRRWLIKKGIKTKLREEDLSDMCKLCEGIVVL